MRERVVLFGDAALRPEGLERALVRAGFSLAQAGKIDPASAPDLALVAVRDAGPELEQALVMVQAREWPSVPVIVLLATTAHGGITRALSLGATDAVTAPVDLAELCARLEARLRSRAEMQRAASVGSLQAELFMAIEEVASAHRPDEMLEKLVQRLGGGLGAAHCACLVPSSDGRYARIVAVHENPLLRDLTVDLFHYPEAVEAAVSGRTVHAPEVLRDGLFLAHLAQWPDSPEVREIESAAAFPMIASRTVRAVIVVRTRRGDSPLTAEQVVLIEQLVNATAALLQREDRRTDDSRRQGLAAATDPLTGCATLDALDRRLRDELERSRRYNTELAFVLVDIDALRELNQRLGPAVGDTLLAELGTLIQSELRGSDFVARYGADEFALLLPCTGHEGARILLNRIAARLEARSWSDIPLLRRPRMAVGVVVVPDPGVLRMEDLLVKAEAALVLSKNGPSASAA